MTGADSAEMGQGGMRVNMVPKDGGNTFRGTVRRQISPTADFASDNCNSPGIGQACAQSNLWGDLTYNPNNKLTNVSQIQDIWDFNPTIGGPIMRDKLWFNYTFRHWGVNQIKADSYADLNPSPFRYTADFSNPGIDDGHIVSNAGRIAWQVVEQGQDLVLPRQPAEVPRPLGHRGRRAARGRRRAGDAHELRQRDQVVAHAHQPVAARRPGSASTIRTTPSSISPR